MDYRDEKRIRFINADCMDILKNTKDNHYDLAIVDVPYGGQDAMDIRSTKGLGSNHYAKRKEFKQFDNVQPNAEYFKELKRVSKHQIVWGWNFLKHADMQGGALVWNKFGTAFGEAELAHCSMFNSVRIYNLRWNGFLKHEGAEVLDRFHPTAKPRKLYEYCLIEFAKKGFKVLDTHGGSCSIARAVRNVNTHEELNIKLDVIEKEKIYYDKALMDYDTFEKQENIWKQAKPSPEAKQEKLF